MKHKSLTSWFTYAALFAATFLASACSPRCATPETNPGPASLEDLEGKKVAVMAESTSDVLLSDTNNFTGITIVRCSSPSELLTVMEEGGADYGITDTVALMARRHNHKSLQVCFNLPGGFDVAVAFNHKNIELCQEFNDFLVQIKSDGTLDEMFARWCSESLDTVHIPQLPELESLQGHPIEVATLADNEPFSFYRNNRWTGFEVELIMRFSIFAGRPVHFSGYSFSEIIPLLRQGQANMAADNMFITPDRADQVLFSHPYYLCKTCCVTSITPNGQ
ncbi:MAG: transporter substrate-binding domain-containing protein [Bacteroidales bacterium]|nr:transporter substrate-binding domain-containing protein [Bacteroidales bacterium]